MPVIVGGAQAALGIAQGIGGLIQNKRATKALERLQTPTYTPARSISDYYNEAKQRYNTSPYASALYNTQMQNINRSTAAGISGLQSRRLGIGGISSLIQGQNDAMLKASASAEQERDRRFSQYGQASGMMGQEERQAFQINKMLPYEKQYNLLAAKAGGGAQIMNAGLQNIGGAANTYGGMKMAQDYYGTQGLQSNPYKNDPYWGRQDPTGNDYYGQDNYTPSSPVKRASYN